jgi:hypothetical protein
MVDVADDDDLHLPLLAARGRGHGCHPAAHM